jgi:sporulation protein YlmC with PRC-barrel domain
LGLQAFFLNRKFFKQDSIIQNMSDSKMSGNDKPLTRDALVSMQVIDARGKLVGKVKDLAFAVGNNGISLTVENEDGDVQTVAWEQIQAASDFIILKPAAQSAYQPSAYQPVQTAAPVQAAQPVTQASSQPLCATCGKPLTWIPQYQRWYCYNDKKYA